MLSLFEKWFAYNFEANKSWSKQLALFENDLTDYCIRSMSHIINVEHLWLSRILGKSVESGDWDILPLSHFERFHVDNYVLFEQISLQFSEDRLITYTNSEKMIRNKLLSDLLFHVLSHSNYHRAQIAKEFRLLDLPVIPTNYIEFC